MMRRGNRLLERGQALLWFALMLPFLLGIVGLATDAGTVYVQRQALQMVADDAARTGAERIDPRTYYDRQALVLDPPVARAAALAYLDDVAPSAPAEVQADPQHVTVTVRRRVPLPFLRAVGIQTATVGARGIASPRNGS